MNITNLDGIEPKEQTIVKLTKVSDDRFEGHHPNGIGEGYSVQGVLIDEVALDHSIEVRTLTRWFHTSAVVAILQKDSQSRPSLVKTLNSTYKIAYV